MREMLIPTPNDLVTLAERVLLEVRERNAAPSAATVLALHGELGAGKTTFTQALAQALGVDGHVVSPTFVIMRLYPVRAHDFFSQLVHIDAYRIESLPEIDVIGFEDMVREPGNLICIEWAGKIKDALPKDAYHITLTPSAIPEDGALRKVSYGYEDIESAGNTDAHPNET